MPILIDGWNFIRDPKSRLKDKEPLQAAGVLIGYLQNFQLTHNDPIILVFDSKREFLDMKYKNSPKLTVVPTRDADDYIKRYIDQIPTRQRRNIRVVSSDNSVYYYARSCYAMVIKCEEFWNKFIDFSQRV